MRTEFCTEFLSIIRSIVLGISFIRDDVPCFEQFVAVHGIVIRFVAAARNVRFSAVVDALQNPFACINNNK